MRRKIFSVLSLCAVLVSTPNFSAIGSTSSSVELSFEDPNVTFVPEGLIWGSKSVAAANLAMDFEKKEILQEFETLKNAGAVRVRKVPVSNEFLYFKDWKTYVPRYAQYKMLGIDEDGKNVGYSQALPTNYVNLATFLITLKQDSCYLDTPLSAAPIQCSITPAQPEKFLRAALRTGLDFDMLSDNLYWIRTQLNYCLNHEKKFKVQKNTLSCPGNLKSFLTSSIKLQDSYLTRSYKVNLDLSRRKAVISVSKRDFKKVAKTAQFQGSDVIRFG
jgi:hypothetical protein